MPIQVKGNLAAFFAMLTWATGFPLVSELLQTWDPMLMAVFRTLIPGLVLTIWAAMTGGLVYFHPSQIRSVYVIGGLGLGIGTLLFVYGQAHAHPVTAAVVVSTLPIASLLIGIVSREERLTMKLALALVLAVAGGTICAVAGNSATEGGATGIGEFSILIAVFLFAWYTRASLKQLDGLSDAGLAGITMIASGVVASLFVSVFLALGIAELRYDFSGAIGPKLGFLLFFSIALSMFLWFWSSRVLGVTIAAFHHNLVPFYVVLIAAFFGAEILPGHILGAGLVFAGAVVAQTPGRR
ncbi:MAG: DMT family transporter [Hyphomicrobiales bacterium]